MRLLGACLCAAFLSTLLPATSLPAPSPQTCGQSLQALIDAAGAGATVRVPPCLYRETLVIGKPLALAGQPGAEIRGSDVWSAGWTYTGGYWTHAGVPVIQPQTVPCERGTSRCNWPEQVFFDGAALLHVASHPTSGQFAVDAQRTLFLADDPAGHTVEVTTRRQWITIKSDKVTITGFRMRHAANSAQSGAIDSGGYSSITIDSNVLSDSAGAVVWLGNGSSLKITGNDISRGGQLGIGLPTVTDSFVQHNRIHDNNTGAFAGGGGLRAGVGTTRLVLDSNEVDHNNGPGLRCGGLCADIVYSNNRIHDNSNEGISQEFSHSAKIFRNAVWHNGSAFSEWAFGAGILIQNSDSCDIYNNTVAWNPNGIAVMEQYQTDHDRTYRVFNTSIHDNVVVMQDQHKVALGWASDYPATRLFDPVQNNKGSSNRFGYTGVPEAGYTRFAWHGPIYSLAVFNATPAGGGDSRYLSAAEQNTALQSAGVPLSP